jgi:hypothetical protein
MFFAMFTETDQMAEFRGSDFEIHLPAGYSDESTYAFALPARASFRPSVVVKTERLTEPTDLARYVDQQLEKIKGVMQNMALVSKGPATHGNLKAYTSVYDWGETPRRVRQKQRYLLLDNPLRVVTLTATHLSETFAEAEALFDAIFLSFKPVAK